MNFKSLFDFKFSSQASEEGLSLAESIGGDMPSKEGYLSHEVIQDVSDAGHVMVNTLWNSRQQAESVLSVYNNDPKIKRATELLGAPPTGFVGDVLGSSS